MSLFTEHFEALKARYPQALQQPLPNNASLIIIPSISLPTGWSKSQTTVRILAPVAYPMAKPDCFWADEDLRLKQNNAMPQATGFNQIPGVSEKFLWFSWHTSLWNPNRDSLVTYMRVVEERFKQVR